LFGKVTNLARILAIFLNASIKPTPFKSKIWIGGFQMEMKVTKGTRRETVITMQSKKEKFKVGSAIQSRSIYHDNPSETPTSVELSRTDAIELHGNNTRRAIFWLSLAVLPVLVSVTSAYLISQVLTPVYAARTEIILHVQQSGDAVVRYLASQVAIIKSSAILEPVSAKSGLKAESIDERLSVEFPKGGNVMRIQYANENSNVALDITQKILTQYELVVGQVEENESTSHQVLSQPRLLEKPVAPKPLQLAAIGGAIGLMISLGASVLVVRLRKTS
jgi:capsular polysaccharide biosynthesis protein